MYVKVTIHGAGSNDDLELDYASDTAVVSQVEKVVERVENEAKRSLTFKMSPIQNNLKLNIAFLKSSEAMTVLQLLSLFFIQVVCLV